jgi:hypothetical protein
LLVFIVRPLFVQLICFLVQNGAVTPGPQDSLPPLSSPVTPYQMIPAFYDTNGALRLGAAGAQPPPVRLVPPLLNGHNGFPNLNNSLNLGSPLSSAMR